MLTLNEKHEYWDGDIQYDATTAIIKEAGLMPEYNSPNSEWYMVRGSFAHLATELYDKGILDESTLDPAIVGYLESYKKLGLKYKPEEIEMMLADPLNRTAGTLDRPDCDLKTGSPAGWHFVQASAYWRLKKINGLGAAPIKTWYLQEDGSMPKVKEYSLSDLIRGENIFHAALIVVRARRELLK
jgi:hypothetical protein